MSRKNASQRLRERMRFRRKLARGQRFMHEGLTCPTCAHRLNASTCMSEATTRGPVDGDITLCARCRTLLIFADNMTSLRVMTPVELSALPPDMAEKLERMRVEKLKLVCQRAITTHIVVPGTRFDLKCGTCGENVGTAPSGQRALAEYPGMTIVCDQCFTPEPDAEFRMADGVLEEIRGPLDRSGGGGHA